MRQPQPADGLGLMLIRVEIGDVDDMVDREDVGSVEVVQIVELLLSEVNPAQTCTPAALVQRETESDDLHVG